MTSLVQSPTRSALVSLGFTLWTIAAVVLSFAVADDATRSWVAFSGWFSTHYVTILIGLIINPAPFYRARQAILNAQKGT